METKTYRTDLLLWLDDSFFTDEFEIIVIVIEVFIVASHIWNLRSKTAAS